MHVFFIEPAIGRCLVHGNLFSAVSFLSTSLKVCYKIVFCFNIYKSHIVKDKGAETDCRPEHTGL